MIPLVLLFLSLEQQPQQVIALQGETHHVQGIAIDAGGKRAFITAVDREARKGFLFEYELPSGKRLRSIEIQDGDRYHPGGLDLRGDSLWIPVAEYKRASTAVIQKRNRRTLALEAQWRVNDHIGCVAVSHDRIWGGNWDSRQIYEWTLDGREISKRDRVSAVSYQDMKFRNGSIAAAGLTRDGGALDLLDPQTLAPKRTIAFGKTDRGVAFTHEGMDLTRRRIYLLPEDAPSRIFVFTLP